MRQCNDATMQPCNHATIYPITNATVQSGRKAGGLALQTSSARACSHCKQPWLHSGCYFWARQNAPGFVEKGAAFSAKNAKDIKGKPMRQRYGRPQAARNQTKHSATGRPCRHA